jgi:hypothetical protein
MTNPLIRYPLDPTGTNPDNLVVGEVKTLATTTLRAVAPNYGPFYTESVKVYDHGNGELLARGTHYEIVDMLQSATLKFGFEIAQVILITNQSVGSQVRINYQTLGGPYQSNTEGLTNLYDAIMSDNRPVNWIDVLNKPTEYTPTLHRHLLEDVYGFEPIVVELERIRNAMVLSNVPAFESLIEWVKSNAGNTIITDPIFPSTEPNQQKVINVFTTNNRNGATYYWSIQHTTTTDEYFVASSGMFQVYQNRSNFTVKTTTKVPSANKKFNIIIRKDRADGPIATTIEDITLLPVNADANTVIALINACCIMEPGININAMSFFLAGE